MASQLVQAHIRAEARLRDLVRQAIERIWHGLPAYDKGDVPQWLSQALPVVLAGQRASVALTEGYLARALERAPIGLNPNDLIGAAVRNGTPPEVVYRRPFVEHWSALRDGARYEDALSRGLDRATSSAETDVQLTMRETLRQVGGADERILGYRRVPDAGACGFCRLVAGQRYTVEQLMPVHNHCGCGVDVITEANRGDFTGKRANDLSVPGAAVHEHGELGPTLISSDHIFTTESQALG